MTLSVDFIGIGSGKCGSTWLYNNLIKHPQIYDRNLKELNYFSDLYKTHSTDWYSSQFSGCTNHQKKGEFSVTYLTHPLAAQRIHTDCPSTKLIAILRNPVKRTFSNYLHSIRKGDIAADYSFSDYANEELRLRPGRYVEHLEEFYQLFDRQQIHVVITEEFTLNPIQGYHELYKFIGLDDVDFVPPDYDEKNNVARSYRFLWIENILVRTYRWLSRKGYTKIVKIIVDSPPVSVIRRLNQGNKRVPQIDAASQSKLEAYYRPFNKRLATLLQKDLSIWEG